jgi:hypothetical protein
MHAVQKHAESGHAADHADANAQGSHQTNGYAQVMAILKNGQPTPQRIAAVIEQHPQDRPKLMELLQQKLGNSFTQRVIAAVTHDRQEDHKDKPDDGQIHIITEAGLRHLRQSGPAGIRAANELYDNPDAYIVLKAGQHMPEGWKGNATMLFPSFALFQHAHEHGQLPNNLKAVVYDNEHWEQTPPNEKANAAEFAKKFGNLAHHLGLTFIAAPTRKFFAEDARYADIIDVQLQDREAHTGSYAKALDHDLALAHHENPDVEVVAQITSSVRHLDPTHTGRGKQGIAKAEHDIVANSDDIDGFWGYVYQQNPASIKAGQTILKDLADKKRKGAKI